MAALVSSALEVAGVVVADLVVRDGDVVRAAGQRSPGPRSSTSEDWKPYWPFSVMQLCSSVLSAPAIIPAPGTFSVSVSYRRVQPVLEFWLIAAPSALRLELLDGQVLDRHAGLVPVGEIRVDGLGVPE